MDANILLFIFLLIGITFSFAAVSLTIGIQKGGEKTYLYLGLMGICVGLYYLSYPGIVITEPDSVIFKLGLFFFLANFALLPWFFCSYTGYCKIKTQWLLTSGMVVSVIFLLFDSFFNGIPIWNIIGHIVLAGIIIFGFAAGFYQKNKGEHLSAWFIISGLILLSILTIDDIIRIYFPSVYPFNIPDEILPLDYFLVFFMIVMGLKLARDMQNRFLLEQSLNLQEKRWVALLEEVQLLVVGIDRDEKINYVNPFFLDLTGFKKEEIEGHHFMKLIPEKDKKSLRELSDTVKRAEDLPHYQHNILTSQGEEKTISWSLVGMYDSSGEFINSVSIGSDISEQLKAFEEIISLKSKLEEENIMMKAELGKVPNVGKINGNSDAIQYVLQRALQVAPTDTTVLLEGETGVGKELIANYIQQNSQRRDKAFIKINCAAIPATLLESELFGHTKGAFTGADKAKKGMVEMANEGTLLLDEIGEFPMELQPKLLRFLQEGEYNPLGSESPKKVDIRVIAATNRELMTEIEKGRFRNDLYYRLYVYPITIPPLRNRVEDIPELIDVFVKQFAKKHIKPIIKVSRLVIEELSKYSWPGNIRELENVLERAVIVSNTDTIKVKDLSPAIAKSKISTENGGKTLLKLEDAEREHILKALNQTNWQVHGPGGAAEILGINPNTLRSRMKKLDITRQA